MKQRKWMFRLISALLVLILVFAEVSIVRMDVYAKKDKTKTEKESDEELTDEEKYELELKEEKKKRKKIPIETNAIDGWPQGPKTYCESGMMIDLDTGAILYEKNANEALYPASITKVLTALVALENCSLDEQITFSQASIDILGNGYASIGMKPGEKLTMEDALYGMMLASANEVAYAICEHFGGDDYANGIAMMNERAKSLGCTNSNFVNPNGIFDENHRTTAHDMALIAKEAYKSDVFRKIIFTKQYTIGETKKTKEERTFQNHHKMLWESSDYYYENCIGGKTGYTSEALNTLVTFAEKDGRHLLCVTLMTRGHDTYKDTKKILEYGFNNFQTVSIDEYETDPKIASTYAGTLVSIPKGASFQDLQRENSPAGVSYRFHDQFVGGSSIQTSSPGSSEEPAPADTSDGNSFEITQTEENSEAEPEETGFIGKAKKVLQVVRSLINRIPEKYRKKALLGALGVLIVLLIIIRILLAIKRSKKKRRRRRKNKRKRH